MDAQLIINADDYAISPGVSEAIRKLIEAGRITATSCMTGAEEWPEEGRRLKALVPGTFSAGLHVTLTDQVACVRTPTLAPDGVLPPLKRLWWGVRAGQIMHKDIEAEVRAQVARFIDVYGGPPGHVDGHHHVQQFPLVRDVILDLWSDETVPYSSWLRISADTPVRIFKRGTAPLKALLIAAAGRGLKKAARRRGISVNDGFAGIYNLQPGADFATVCRCAFAYPAPKTVFMCHPGHADSALAKKDSVTYQRDAEFDFLLGDQFRDMIETSHVSLVPSFF